MAESIRKIESPDLQKIEKHWFLRGNNFIRYPLLGGKGQLYLFEEDRGHAISGKKALYFDLIDEAGDRLPIFFGIEYKNIGFYPRDERIFRHGFDFGTYAKSFYGMIKNLRKEHKRFREFHTWFRSYSGGIPYIKDCVEKFPLEGFYKSENFSPDQFVFCTGQGNIDFYVGSYDGKFYMPDAIANHLLLDTFEDGFKGDMAALLFSVKDEQIDNYQCTLRNIEEGTPISHKSIVVSPSGFSEVGDTEETSLQDNPLESHYDDFFMFKD